MNEKYADKYKSDSLDLGKNWRFTEISKNPEFMSLLFKITEEYYRESSNSVDHLYKVKKAYMDKFGYKDVEVDKFEYLLPKVEL